MSRMGTEMEFSQKILDQVRELHEVVKIEVQRLKSEADEAAKTERIWSQCRDYLSKGWSLHFIALIEREAPRLKKMRANNHPIIPMIEDTYHHAKKDSDLMIRRYPAFLEDSCKSAELELDSDSRHPKYRLEHGFFRLEVNEKKRTALLSDHEGRLANLPADVDAVVETIQRENKRIFGRPFNGSKFLKILRNQYKAILKKEKLSDGHSLPIRHITRRLGKNVKGFRTDEFLVDLSRLTEKGPFEIDGRRLDLQQTKDTNQGMLLHGAASRGYIGFVIFKEI
ncbi:MAG: hypothetical protein U9N55_10210 [candidate division Zixibacteria bacterium]|nr:hypothetical protein [candidate division Zixibacteria bacterium]